MSSGLSAGDAGMFGSSDDIWMDKSMVTRRTQRMAVGYGTEQHILTEVFSA